MQINNHWKSALKPHLPKIPDAHYFLSFHICVHLHKNYASLLLRANQNFQIYSQFSAQALITSSSINKLPFCFFYLSKVSLAFDLNFLLLNLKIRCLHPNFSLLKTSDSFGYPTIFLISSTASPTVTICSTSSFGISISNSSSIPMISGIYPKNLLPNPLRM